MSGKSWSVADPGLNCLFLCALYREAAKTSSVMKPVIPCLEDIQFRIASLGRIYTSNIVLLMSSQPFPMCRASEPKGTEHRIESLLAT